LNKRRFNHEKVNTTIASSYHTRPAIMRGFSFAPANPRTPEAHAKNNMGASRLGGYGGERAENKGGGLYPIHPTHHFFSAI